MRVNTLHKVFVFGSRASGSNRRFSDVDIGIEGDQPLILKTRSQIAGEFEESDFPYRVDIVDFSQVGSSFKQLSKKHLIYLN